MPLCLCFALAFENPNVSLSLLLNSSFAMALETIGGAIASSFFQAVIDKLASEETIEYFRNKGDDENLQSRLKMALFTIDVVANDAEQKQINNRNVKEWLIGVKDGVLDAQDLMEEIILHIQVSKSKSKSKSKHEAAESQTTNQELGMLNVSPTSIDKNIVSRLKELVQKLESLVGLKDSLFLNAVNHGFNVGSPMLILPSFPSMESPMYGRNDDQTTLSKWLKSQDKKLSVISMVGMGGIGKTTLAQHLYIDPMIVGRFDVRAWVNVSQDFDVCRITRVLLESITGSVIETTTDQIILQEKLKEQLTGKKFFIVLDNVWIEDRMKWRSFKTPFTYGAQGSKILVTTRSGVVASVTASDEIHQLHQLDEEDSWTLFAKHAFEGFDDSQITTRHENIGKKVADKCKGLPLALIAIGDLLCINSSLLQWVEISESGVWDLADGTRIVPALMVSYQYLPTHLKKCFEYCALFPKGYLYEKDHLCLLWMAENLIQCPLQHKKSMKKVAESYFNDLILRSFFQPSTKYRNYFVMHDLHHDLSKSIFGEFCFTWEDRKSKNMTSITRHFSFLCDELGSPKGLETLFRAKKLRTFLPLSTSCYEYQWLLCFNSNKLVLSELFSKCKRLRVLSLCGCVDMIELPETIGNLKHLHQLDLSRTRITTLPDTLCSLHYLQTLKVRDCQLLEELPMNLHKLVNLCYLDFSGTKVTVMPKEMGKLKNLEVLSSFYVGEGNDSGIQQLGDLNLHGNLLVAGLENVMDPEDSVSANLERKINLLKLELTWNAVGNSSEKERAVLNNLKPSELLKELSIEKYCGTSFPDWFGDNSLSCLVSVRLSNCENCVVLPSLGVMTSLKHLRITGLSGIVMIGREFYSGEDISLSTPFPSLETLVFKDMEGWVEWESKVICSAFPRLQKLSLVRCPNLKGNLPEKLECLVRLKIYDCKKLVASMPSSPSFRTICLTDCAKVQFPYKLPTLKFVEIRRCCMERSSVKLIGRTLGQCATSIELLKMEDCTNVYFPMLEPYRFLVKLDIIGSCKSLEIFRLNLFPNLDSLDIYRCTKFATILQEKEKEHLKLTSLSIGECPNFASFPEGGLFAPKLQRFEISKLENLKTLPESMQILLPSLHKITIDDCPQLEPFSDGGLPSSLRNLFLIKCSKLLVNSLKRALQTDTSLCHVCIENVDVESFPDQGLLPNTLTRLTIYDCGNLRQLDYKGLNHLASLTSLTIHNCPNIQCLPKEGLPKSISNLQIWGDCPLLIERCQKYGKDRDKISHIGGLMIGRRRSEV